VCGNSELFVYGGWVGMEIRFVVQFHVFTPFGWVVHELKHD
jgi:hypothetical protein